MSHVAIPTIFVGPMVRPGRYDARITHYSVLRTIEEAYGPAPTGHAAEIEPIIGVWQERPAAAPPPEPAPPSAPNPSAERNTSGKKCGVLGVDGVGASIAILLWRGARDRRRQGHNATG